MKNEFYVHLCDRTKGFPEVYGIIDYENELYTRLLYNLSGQIVGYQQYNWREGKEKRNDSRGRYWTFLSKTEHKLTRIGICGIEMLRPLEPIYLVEGSFEQITARQYGINALAVLSNHPKHLKNWVYSQPVPVIALCQNDSAGRKLASCADSAIYLPCDLDELDLKTCKSLIPNAFYDYT
jgi:hypothetical protein